MDHDGDPRVDRKLGTGKGPTALVATLTIAVALLGVASCTAATATTTVAIIPTGSGTRDVQLTWTAAAQPPDGTLVAAPVPLGAGLVALVSDGSAPVYGEVSVSTWNTTDGSTWSRLSEPGAIADAGRSISIAAACPDGRGGLIAGGTTAIGSVQMLAPKAGIWHSVDGRTWTLATVERAVGSSVMGVAARPGTMVAVGLVQPSFDPVTRAVAWYSSDGSTWKAATVSDANGTSLVAVAALGDKFIAFGDSGFGNAVWTSADGSAWTRVASLADRFAPGRLVTFGDRIVAVADPSGKPASLMSKDGLTWNQGTLPVGESDSNGSVDDVVVLDGRLVAIGGWSLSRTPEESPKPSYALLWVSDDGVTWRPLASGSGLTGSAGGAAVLGDRIIVTSRDSSGRRMFVGTLSP